MQPSLLSLLLITSKVPTVRYINSNANSGGDIFVYFVESPQNSHWVYGHLLGLAVQKWSSLSPEDLPRYVATNVADPISSVPQDIVGYFLKMASIEYLNGCQDLQPYLERGAQALQSGREDLYDATNELLEMYRRGE